MYHTSISEIHDLTEDDWWVTMDEISAKINKLWQCANCYSEQVTCFKTSNQYNGFLNAMACFPN